MTLVDGGAGDEDRRADGVIADPGGPGVPRAPWTFTISVSASVDPAADFNFFLEECSETRKRDGVHAADPAPVGGPGSRSVPRRHRSGSR